MDPGINGFPHLKPAWSQHLLSLLPAVRAEHTTALAGIDALFTNSVDYCLDNAGKRSSAGIQWEGVNKTTRRLQWAIRTLTSAYTALSHNTPLLSTSNTHRASIALCTLQLDDAFHIAHRTSKPRDLCEKEKWDHVWQRAFLSSTPEEREHPASGLTAAHFKGLRHSYMRGLDKLSKAMSVARLKDHKAYSQANIGVGRKKVIKRFFGKLAPPITLRRIYCKNPKKQYPGMLTTSLAGISAATTFAGPDCAQAFRNHLET
eukprot:3941466-Rhodomonas_salina.1